MVRLRFGAMMFVALFVSLMIGQIEVAAQATPAATPATYPDSATAIQAGADWIASQQGEDGAWLGFSGTSDAGSTVDAVLALAAAGNAGATVDLESATAFLDANGKGYAETGPGAAAKLAMVAVALGQDPHSIGGVDAFELAAGGLNADTGMFGNGIFDTALVLMAFGAVGEHAPEDIVQILADHQIEDGSWAFDGSTDAGMGDTNTTALVVQALVASGYWGSPMITSAIGYLRSTQLAGGFPFQGGDMAMPDANSTGVVLQAMIAAGQVVSGEEAGAVSAALAAFQNSDGSFSYMLDPRDMNIYASVQALPAMAGQAYPIGAADVYKSRQALPACTAEQLATPVLLVELPCAA